MSVKIAKKKLPNFMTLLKHVEEYHRLEPVENDKEEDHGNTNIPNEIIDEKEHTEECKLKLDEFIS